MSKEVKQELKRITLSEVERLKFENIELKKRAVEQQYSALEQQKKAIVESFCKTHNCKEESITMIDLDNGVVEIKN